MDGPGETPKPSSEEQDTVQAPVGALVVTVLYILLLSGLWSYAYLDLLSLGGS